MIEDDLTPIRNRRNGSRRFLFFRFVNNLLGQFRFRRHRVQPEVVEPDPLEDSPSDFVGFVTTEKGGFPIVRK